jgi:hypothetical protein
MTVITLFMESSLPAAVAAKNLSLGRRGREKFASKHVVAGFSPRSGAPNLLHLRVPERGLKPLSITHKLGGLETENDVGETR